MAYPNYHAGRIVVEHPERTRRLRREQTDAERVLWQRLRAGQLNGCKFRRQHEFDAFILDFYCAAARLAVELDGGQHLTDEGVDRDKRRELRLAQLGVRVLRFTDTEVLEQCDAVLDAILSELHTR